MCVKLPSRFGGLAQSDNCALRSGVLPKGNPQTSMAEVWTRPPPETLCITKRIQALTCRDLGLSIPAVTGHSRPGCSLMHSSTS